MSSKTNLKTSPDLKSLTVSSVTVPNGIELNSFDFDFQPVGSVHYFRSIDNTFKEGFYRKTSEGWETTSGSVSNSSSRTAGEQMALDYVTLNGLSETASGKLSALLSGMSDLGILNNLYDAGFYGAEFQPSGGNLAVSLLGSADLEIIGEPVRGRYGFEFTNDDVSNPTSPQRLYGAVPMQNGNWSFLSSAGRKVYAELIGQRRAVNLFQVSPLALTLQMSDGGNWRSTAIAGGGTSNFTGIKSANSPVHKPILMRNSKFDGVESFEVSDLQDFEQSLSGRGPVPFDKISFAAGSTNGTTFSNYFDGYVNYWFAWNNPISDVQTEGLHALIESTIAPKSRWVLEGDSIASFGDGWGYHLESASGFFGANIEVINVAKGGDTSVHTVDDIGGEDGINDTHSSDDFPVFCLIQSGSNDAGDGVNDTANAAESFANLRLLWSAARARGMKVVACTIPGSIFSDAGQAREFYSGNSGPLSHDVFNQLNDLIRADSENYDYLLDVDQILTESFGETYWQNNICFHDGVHPGENEDGSGPIVMAALGALVDSEMP